METWTGPKSCPVVNFSPKVAVILPYCFKAMELPFQPSPQESSIVMKRTVVFGVKQAVPGHQLSKIIVALKLPVRHSRE